MKRSTDGGATWTTSLSNTTLYHFCLGKPAVAGGYPTIFVAGAINGRYGVHRSDYKGATWDWIAQFPAGSIWQIGGMCASWSTFGRVICSIAGQSYLDGTPNRPSVAMVVRLASKTTEKTIR